MNTTDTSVILEDLLACEDYYIMVKVTKPQNSDISQLTQIYTDRGKV